MKTKISPPQITHLSVIFVELIIIKALLFSMRVISHVTYYEAFKEDCHISKHGSMLTFVSVS